VYRHFPDREHLVAAISQAARERLALALAEGSAGVSVSGRSAAIERFMAIGAAYVAWATSEPRLCETAFVPCSAAPSRPDDPNAWEILEIALDDLVAEGAMPAERRAEAPMVAWTAVHGLSGMLNGIAGPMFGDRDATVQTMLGAIERALEISATR
jgi:AcrR family transcriptional regulator